MRSGAYASINLAAVRHNLTKVRHYAPTAKVMAVIKANAYGHGLLRIAQALDADAFAVARVDEGIALRVSGCTQSITVLEGFTTSEELIALSHYQLDTVIHTTSQLTLLQQAKGQQPLRVWLKIDTGMNRLGFKTKDVADIYQALSQCPLVQQPIGLMTHLANADEVADNFTLQQIRLFNDLTQHYAAPRSIANSAGLLAWQDALSDWVRPGLMLYGMSPFAQQTGLALGLQAVMSLHSHLIAVKPITQGERLGYGGSWLCEHDTLVGVVAIGYGDGYPRSTKTGTPVLVNGQRVPLIGRVSMDMITVDLATQPFAKPGDPVLLWGTELPIEEIARGANTIPYTLTCGITQRVQIVEI